MPEAAAKPSEINPNTCTKDARPVVRSTLLNFSGSVGPPGKNLRFRRIYDIGVKWCLFSKAFAIDFLVVDFLISTCHLNFKSVGSTSNLQHAWELAGQSVSVHMSPKVALPTELKESTLWHRDFDIWDQRFTGQGECFAPHLIVRMKNECPKLLIYFKYLIPVIMVDNSSWN